MDLREHGALVVDLQLCHDVEAICLFLREAPAGTHQLVLYNGSHFFSADERYRTKLRAVHRRAPPAGGALRDEGQLRHIIAALIVFCSIRGAGLAVLELTGLPLARQSPMLLTPLARSLCCLHFLQRLHLAGCGLHDRGFAALLPHLINALPKLSRLSLARNGLRDVRLLTHFLQGRAAAQCRGAAVALGLLDLSSNPGLGAMRKSNIYSRPGHRRGAMRNSLVRVICEALQHGLILRTVRLRSMNLAADDMRPLLELLMHEVACRQNTVTVAPPYDFPLVEVSLEGNPLDAEHVGAILQALAKLREPESWERIVEGYPGFDAGEGRTTWHEWGSGLPPRKLPEIVLPQRAHSQPPPTVDKLEAFDSERNALSEGDADPEDAEPGTFDHRNRLAKKRQMQDELSVLTLRLGARRRHRHEPGGGHSGKERRRRTRHRAGSAHQQDVELQSRGIDEFGAMSSSAGLRSSDRSSITLGAIPDRGVELGFGPPPGAEGFPAYDTVAPGMGSSSEEEMIESSRRSGWRGADGSEGHAAEPRGIEVTTPFAVRPATAPGPEPGGVPNDRMHAKLEMLHELFEQGACLGRAAAAGPEVLRCALDLISSEASLPADSEEAFELLANRMADLQEAVEGYDETEAASQPRGAARHAEYMARQTAAAAASQASAHSASQCSSHSSSHGGRRGHSSGTHASHGSSHGYSHSAGHVASRGPSRSSASSAAQEPGGHAEATAGVSGAARVRR